MYEVHRRDAYTDLVLHGCWSAPAMVGVICLHVEDILVSLVISLISCTFRIPAHEEDQYSYVYKILSTFLSKANRLKQTKAGPQSLGTHFLVWKYV